MGCSLGRVGRARATGCGGALLLLACATTAAGAPSHRLSGRLVDAFSREPVAGAWVVLEERGQEAVTDGDGTYTFVDLPSGTYHLTVCVDGFLPARSAVTIDETTEGLDIALTPHLQYSDEVAVSAGPRDPFMTYQPSSTLAGRDLARQVEGQLGATLRTQPGLAERSFGPAPSRPVIRGLDGDRVLILQDGQSMADLSSQSADHGVPVNPLAAKRIEVVRGPATLLHGANAVGGLVNVVTDQLPVEPRLGLTGAASFDLGSAANELGGALDALWGDGRWAVHGSASTRRAGDLGTPAGRLANSRSRSAFGNLGVSRTWADGAIGVHYGYDNWRYGIPVVEDEAVEITPERHAVNLRAEHRAFGRVIESIRGTVGIRRYRHDELDEGAVDTTFRNDAVEVEALASHRQVRRLKGLVGARAGVRSFSALGAEALSPPVDHRSLAAFLYEEVVWSQARVQLGGRFEHTAYEPSGEALPARRFTNLSVSVGLLWHPDPSVTVAASLARASRRPALEELYFHGLHIGNFAFEVGNPALDSEHALGLDLSLRWRLGRALGELTYFRNAIDDFIFRHPAGEFEDGFPVLRFEAADSMLQGLESRAELPLAPALTVHGGVDYVRGALRETAEPLPRMPPLRGLLGLRVQRNAFQAGVEATAARRQARVFGTEEPTGGYGLVTLHASYAFTIRGRAHAITARVDNATNALYRNHLSFIRHHAPEIGRNVKVVYTLGF